MHNRDCSDRVRSETVLDSDLRMVEFLRKEYKTLPEVGFKSRYIDSICARFEELANNRSISQRQIDTVYDILKMTLNQTQLAMSQINSLNRMNDVSHALPPPPFPPESPIREKPVDLQGS